MHDSISLEKRGLPSAVIISDEFVPGVKAIARICGLPDYPFAVVKHPIGSLAEDVLEERAKAAAPQVMEILLAH